MVDRIEKFDASLVHMRMTDNPGLTDDTIARYEGAYAGHFRQRYIEGLWAGASGLIFPTWKALSGAPLPKGVPQYSVALDYGIAGVFAALMFEKRKKLVAAVGEMYHDARVSEHLTNAELADRLVAWVVRWRPPQGLQVYVDPATPNEFKRILRKRGFLVRNADNNVKNGIINTASRLESGGIVIGDCPNLIDELAGYQWDPKAAERGEDRPLAVHDHACDALRYYAHSTGKMWRAGTLPVVPRAVPIV